MSNNWYVATPANGGSDSNPGTQASPFATPGYAATKVAHTDKLWIQSGTYTLTTSTPGAGGPMTFSANLDFVVEGYQTTPGDLGMPPVISAGSITGVVLISGNGTYNYNNIFVNLSVDGNNGAGNSGIYNNGYGCSLLCIAKNCSNGGTSYGFSGGPCIACYANNCSNGFYLSSSEFWCWANACGTGFSYGAYDCIASACTTVGFAGSYDSAWYKCVSYGNAGWGFQDLRGGKFIDCVAIGNTSGGFAPAAQQTVMINCAFYADGAGSSRTSATPALDRNAITLTANPYTSSNFQANSTAGAGALLRGVGLVPPGLTNNGDVGALQHADPTGGSGLPMNRGILTGGRM